MNTPRPIPRLIEPAAALAAIAARIAAAQDRLMAPERAKLARARQFNQ